MRNRKLCSIGTGVIMTGLLSLAGGVALAAGGAMKPEMAAKREMVRQQQEQRVTPEKRQAAAQALKAERLKILRARQAAKHPAPLAIENK